MKPYKAKKKIIVAENSDINSKLKKIMIHIFPQNCAGLLNSTSTHLHMPEKHLNAQYKGFQQCEFSCCLLNKCSFWSHAHLKIMFIYKYTQLRANALIKRGSMYMQQQQPLLSTQDFNIAAEIDTRNPDVYHHRGQVRVNYITLVQIILTVPYRLLCLLVAEDLAGSGWWGSRRLWWVYSA